MPSAAGKSVARTVNLHPDLWERAWRLGNGGFSRGIRRALELLPDSEVCEPTIGSGKSASLAQMVSIVNGHSADEQGGGSSERGEPA